MAFLLRKSIAICFRQLSAALGKRKTMDIQTATLSDVASICKMADQINAIHHHELPGLFTDPVHTKDSKEFWSKQLEAENSKFLVAKIKNSVVGFITAKISENNEVPFLTSNKVCRIGTIIVSESYQNKGIGGELMSAIENWAIDCGATNVRLEVMEFNENARSFYKNNDYVLMSRIMAKSIA